MPKATQLLSGELSGDQRLGSTLFQEAKNTDLIGVNLSARNNFDLKICVPNLQFSNFTAETQEPENAHGKLPSTPSMPLHPSPPSLEHG